MFLILARFHVVPPASLYGAIFTPIHLWMIQLLFSLMVSSVSVLLSFSFLSSGMTWCTWNHLRTSIIYVFNWYFWYFMYFVFYLYICIRIFGKVWSGCDCNCSLNGIWAQSLFFPFSSEPDSSSRIISLMLHLCSLLLPTY